LKELNLPEYSFTIAGEKGKEMIFDPIRKKYVRLTPEEWVRQNFAQYLVQHGKYPAGLIIIEAAFRLYNTRKRIDILVHNRKAERVMIVECKSDTVNIGEEVIEQAATYNMQFRVPYLVITNGMVNIAIRFNKDYSEWVQLDFIPMYDEL
jgi:hypothetical protein